MAASWTGLKEAGAAQHRAMFVRRGRRIPHLSGARVFLEVGKGDPLPRFLRAHTSLSGWRKAEVLLYERGERAEAATLLDKCVSPLCAQATLHHRRATAHRALGA